MKSVELKQAKVTGPNGEKANLSTLEIIKQLLNVAPKDGFTRADFKKRGRIDTALEALSPEATVLELEDQDFEALKEAVDSMKWAMRDPFIFDFLNQFE